MIYNNYNSTVEGGKFFGISVNDFSLQSTIPFSHEHRYGHCSSSIHLSSPLFSSIDKIYIFISYLSLIESYFTLPEQSKSFSFKLMISFCAAFWPRIEHLASWARFGFLENHFESHMISQLHSRRLFWRRLQFKLEFSYLVSSNETIYKWHLQYV